MHVYILKTLSMCSTWLLLTVGNSHREYEKISLAAHWGIAMERIVIVYNNYTTIYIIIIQNLLYCIRTAILFYTALCIVWGQ